ncbi:MAG: hypothetical protein ACSW8D_16460 [Prevotella sp.]
MMLLMMLTALPSCAQTKPKFSVVSFREDPRATAASQPPYRQTNDDGDTFTATVTENTTGADKSEHRRPAYSLCLC